jgi:hypothetical protein
MAYIITYQQNNEEHQLEWVAPTGWSTDTIRECFEQQFPSAVLLQIEQQP